MAPNPAIILAFVKSGKKHIHESDHSDSDIESTNMPEHSAMEISQGKEAFVSNNPSSWINVQKRKGKRDKPMYNLGA